MEGLLVALDIQAWPDKQVADGIAAFHFVLGKQDAMRYPGKIFGVHKAAELAGAFHGGDSIWGAEM